MKVDRIQSDTVSFGVDKRHVLVSGMPCLGVKGDITISMPAAEAQRLLWELSRVFDGSEA